MVQLRARCVRHAARRGKQAAEDDVDRAAYAAHRPSSAGCRPAAAPRPRHGAKRCVGDAPPRHRPALARAPSIPRQGPQRIEPRTWTAGPVAQRDGPLQDGTDVQASCWQECNGIANRLLRHSDEQMRRARKTKDECGAADRCGGMGVARLCDSGKRDFATRDKGTETPVHTTRWPFWRGETGAAWIFHGSDGSAGAPWLSSQLCRCGLAFTVCLGVVTPVASWCSMVQRDAPWCNGATGVSPRDKRCERLVIWNASSLHYKSARERRWRALMANAGMRGRPVARLVLSAQERSYLERQVRRHRVARSLSERCRVILRCADGLPSKDVAAELGLHEHTAGKRRPRFLKDRFDGLLHEARPRPPRTRPHSPRACQVRPALRTTP